MKEIYAMLTEYNTVSVLVRLALAVICGGLVGLERGRKRRPAGFRTHMLVCLGAAMTMLISQHLWLRGYTTDLSRLGAQVVSGIGFLGAGTILVTGRHQVKGLTTAAGLWASACIGLAIGAGCYLVALLSFAAVMVTITVLARLEQKFHGHNAGAYYIELEDMHLAKTFYNSRCREIASVEIVPAKSGLPGHVGMELVMESDRDRQEVFHELQDNDEITIAIPLQT